MNVLSLFDGISCGQLALQKAGIKVDKYFASEIDKYAIKVTQENFPETVQLGDVTKWRTWKLPKIDLLIGGSPCQSLSITQSKTREGLDGKSKLFFSFIDVLSHVKPKYFLFENVASMSKECKGIISGLLGCEPVFINSNVFAAQDRPRLYWTNIPVSISGLTECNTVLKDIMETDVSQKYYYKQPVINIDMTKQVCGELVVNSHDLVKRVFNPNFKVHTLTCVSGGYQHKKVMDNGRCRKLTPLEYERCQTLPDGYNSCIGDAHRYNCIGNGWTVDVIAHILGGIL